MGKQLDAELLVLAAQFDRAVAEVSASQRFADLEADSSPLKRVLDAEMQKAVDRYCDIAGKIESTPARTPAGIRVKLHLVHHLMREATKYPEDIDLLTWIGKLALHIRQQSDRVHAKPARAA